MNRLPRYWPIVAVFVTMAVLQASIAAFSIQLLSAVRAYVTGESLYSKGQKDAQIYLLDYAENHRETDYQRFLAALAVPLGDKAAREALQRPEPDIAKATQGFLDGGNHPDDIAGLIRMFRWFHRVPFMSEPIATWSEGDGVIEQMQALVAVARERLLAGDQESGAVKQMRVQVPTLNARLTQLESKFSAQLGEASRFTQSLLLALNAGIALLLTFSGLAFVRRSARIQAATEAEVIHRQESLQRLLDSAAEGLFGVDLEGRCTFINRAALTMLGYERESELLGRDIHALIYHSRADGQPRLASESQVYQAYRSRLASHAANEVFWRRDGSSFPVEYWSHPVVHDDHVQGAVATFFDISERIKMQTALRRGELRTERLIDAVTDGVVTIDAQHRIVLFNRAAEAMFGTSAAQALGSSFDRFVAEPLAGGMSTESVAAPEAVRELVGRRASGEAFPAEASVSRLETEGGLLTTVVLRDVTARHLANAERRAREALEAANQAKTAFLSRMSHELRTPLNAVIGFAQLLRIDTVKPLSPEQFERVRHIESAGAHLLALVNDVLDLSRIESGDMAVTQGSVALAAVVEQASMMISPLVTEAGIEVFVSTGRAQSADRQPTLFNDPAGVEQDVWVQADEVRLRQVLVNLLSNAVKYNRPGGRVTLSWRVADQRCTVLVEDTGQGIAPEKLASLFQPFNRLGAESTQVEGTGIGLVLSRELAEIMGGELRIFSTLGEGTTAELTLRLAKRPQPTGQRPMTAVWPRAVRSDAAVNVLYAEDDIVNAELMRQIVTLRPSVSLRVAENGTVALQMARSDPPDLLLVDMNLGDMTGIALAQALRKDRLTRDIRLVALSADALPEQIEAAKRNGFEGYLTKPIDFRELLTLLDGK